MKLFCYRVWYTDGTAVLIDAYSQEEAERRAALRVAHDPDIEVLDSERLCAVSDPLEVE